MRLSGCLSRSWRHHDRPTNAASRPTISSPACSRRARALRDDRQGQLSYSKKGGLSEIPQSGVAILAGRRVRGQTRQRYPRCGHRRRLERHLRVPSFEGSAEETLFTEIAGRPDYSGRRHELGHPRQRRISRSPSACWHGGQRPTRLANSRESRGRSLGQTLRVTGRAAGCGMSLIRRNIGAFRLRRLAFVPNVFCEDASGNRACRRARSWGAYKAVPPAGPAAGYERVAPWRPPFPRRARGPRRF